MFVKCLVETCESAKFSYGYCVLHANRFRRYGDPLMVKKAANHAQAGCSVDGCDRPFYGKGMCKLHYTRTVTGKSGLVAKLCEMCGKQTPRSDAKFCSAPCRVKWHRKFGCYRAEVVKEARGTCTIEGCDKPLHSNGLCNVHQRKNWKYGDPLTDKSGQDANCETCGKPCRIRQDNKLCQTCYAMAYYYANHTTEKARRNARRSRVKQATPPWADQDAILAFYMACPAGMEVDHITPIAGKRICGLHVRENLQYLPMSQNRRKSNSHPD